VCATLLQYRVAADHLTDISEAAGTDDAGRVTDHTRQVLGLMTIAKSLLAGLPTWPPGDALVDLLRQARSPVTYSAADIDRGVTQGRSDLVERGLDKLFLARRLLADARIELSALEAAEGVRCEV
jgi:hypothetical protein